MAEKDIGYFASDDRAPPPININNFDSYTINNNWSGGSHHEIVEDDEDYDRGYGGSRLMPSITEEFDDGDASDLFSYDIDRNVSDVVYVVTWRGTEELLAVSMDALIWTLGNDLPESTIIYLVYVFPELRSIPTPIGRLPMSQANPAQKEAYLIKERIKRSEYLQKFLSLCSSSKVQAETVLIESDMEAKAIVDLIPILNIRKLVLGATKSVVRKLKSNSKKGTGGTIDQILHKAPAFCEVKVICEGKEVLFQHQSTTEPPSPSSTSSSPNNNNISTLKPVQLQQHQTNDTIKCGCFNI